MALIECKDVSKNYGSTVSLKQVNLSLEAGRIVGLLGPNGSGKTTLIKLLEHLLVPTSGLITLNELAPGTKTKSFVSYLPDRDFLPDWMKVNDLIKMYKDFYEDFDEKIAREMLENLHIDCTKSIKKLSKGNREKVQLILTMSRQAKIYLLDEPIAGVDPAARDYILHTIVSHYNENAVVLISTHLINDVESILDEVVFLKEGEVVLHENADALREKTGMSVDEYFREVFKC